MLAKCKAKPPRPGGNAHTQKEQLLQTWLFFLHSLSSACNKGLSPGKGPELGHHLSHDRPNTWHCKEKNLETKVQSLKLCSSHISPCVLPQVPKLECSSLTPFLFPIPQWSPRPVSDCNLLLFRWEMTATQHLNPPMEQGEKRNQALTSNLF